MIYLLNVVYIFFVSFIGIDDRTNEILPETQMIPQKRIVPQHETAYNYARIPSRFGNYIFFV